MRNTFAIVQSPPTLDPELRDVIRWLQDVEPVIRPSDPSGWDLMYRTFGQSVADFVADIGKLTVKQADAVRARITDSGWEPAPEFSPFYVACIDPMYRTPSIAMVRMPGFVHDDMTGAEREKLGAMIELAKSLGVKVQPTVGAIGTECVNDDASKYAYSTPMWRIHATSTIAAEFEAAIPATIDAIRNRTPWQHPDIPETHRFFLNSRWKEGTVVSGRPDDPVYEPAGVDLRLTPAPRKLLEDLAAGRRRAFERRWRYASLFTTDGRDFDAGATKTSDRYIGPIQEAAFIAYSEPFPPNPLRTFHVREFVVTDAGRAWLAANEGKPTKR